MPGKRLVPLIAILLLVVVVAASTSAAVPRPSTVARTLLVIDGAYAGALNGYDGCRPVAEVMTTGTVGAPNKQVMSVRLEPCVLRMGGNMEPAFYQWVADSLAGQHHKRDIELVRATWNGAVTHRFGVEDALITSVEFPAFDGSLNALTNMTVTLAGASIRALPPGSAPFVKLDPNVLRAYAFKVTANQQHLTYAASVSEIGARLEPADVQAILTSRSGTASASMRIDDVRLVVSPKEQSLVPWAHGFLFNGSGQEISIVVEALTQNLKDPLFELTLSGVGVTGGNFAFPAATASEQTIPRITYDLYVEELAFVVKPAWS